MSLSSHHLSIHQNRTSFSSASVDSYSSTHRGRVVEDDDNQRVGWIGDDNRGRRKSWRTISFIPICRGRASSIVCLLMDAQPIHSSHGLHKHVWTSEEDALLVECLVELRTDGKFLADNGFRPGYLNMLETMMHEKVPTCTIKVVPHIQSRIKTLKSLWQIIYDMVNGTNTSDYGWDPVGNYVTATKEVWDEYVKTHKKAAIFRNKSFPHYDELTIAFGKDRATGKDAQAGGDILEEMDNQHEEFETSLDNDAQGECDPDVIPDEPEENLQPPPKSGSKKRKRNGGGRNDAYIEAMKEACVSMGEKFGTATLELANKVDKLAYKSDNVTRASTLWGDMRMIDGLTKDEINAGYKMIIHDEMLLAAFQNIPQEEKAEWIRLLLP